LTKEAGNPKRQIQKEIKEKEKEKEKKRANQFCQGRW